MMRHRCWFYGPPLLYMLLIFVFSSISSLTAPDMGWNFEDKIAHMLEYMVLGVLLARAVLSEKKPSARLFMAVFAFGVLYGISDECHQWFVPNRHASPWDVTADAAGVLLGQTLFWRWKKRSRG